MQWLAIEVAGLAIEVLADSVVGGDLERRFGRFEPPHWPFELDPDLQVRVTASAGGQLEARQGRGRARLALGVPCRVEISAGSNPVFADAAVRLAASWLLGERGGVLVHGCAVPMAEGVAVFFGASGVGKSTVAAGLGPALADELVAVRPAADGYEVWGTPWWRGRAGRAPLRALVHLVRGRAPGIRPMTGGQLVRALTRETGRYVPERRHQERVFETLLAMAGGGGIELSAREGQVVADARSLLERLPMGPQRDGLQQDAGQRR